MVSNPYNKEMEIISVSCIKDKDISGEMRHSTAKKWRRKNWFIQLGKASLPHQYDYFNDCSTVSESLVCNITIMSLFFFSWHGSTKVPAKSASVT